MGLDYIYIGIGVLTLVINVILVTAYIKLNSGNKRKAPQKIHKADFEKKQDEIKVKSTSPVSETMGVDDDGSDE